MHICKSIGAYMYDDILHFISVIPIISKLRLQNKLNIMFAVTALFFPLTLKRDLFFFSFEQNKALQGFKILRLFAAVIYSFKVIIRQHQRNVRSSAPLLPSHQWVIITILLLLSSSLTGWPALKYTLNHLQVWTKWPVGSLLSGIKWRNSQQGEHWHLLTQSCLSAQTRGILK